MRQFSPLECNKKTINSRKTCEKCYISRCRPSHRSKNESVIRGHDLRDTWRNNRFSWDHFIHKYGELSISRPPSPVPPPHSKHAFIGSPPPPVLLLLHSDDEDCVLGSESEALQEGARLASRRTGGCTYYCPPGGDRDFAAWGIEERSQRVVKSDASSKRRPTDLQAIGGKEKDDTSAGKGDSALDEKTVTAMSTTSARSEGFEALAAFDSNGKAVEDSKRKPDGLQRRSRRGAVGGGDPSHALLEGGEEEEGKETVSGRRGASPEVLKMELPSQGSDQYHGEGGILEQGSELVKTAVGGTTWRKRRRSLLEEEEKGAFESKEALECGSIERWKSYSSLEDCQVKRCSFSHNSNRIKARAACCTILRTLFSCRRCLAWQRRKMFPFLSKRIEITANVNSCVTSRHIKPRSPLPPPPTRTSLCWTSPFEV